MKRVIYASAFQVQIRNLTNWDTGLVGGNDRTSLIWSNNGIDAGGFRWYPSPQAGSADNQMEGTKYCSLYAELSFIMYPLPNANNQFSDSIRFILFKERQKDILITGAGGGAPVILQFTQFTAPIRTKIWDVQMDKIITYTTGLTTNAAAGTNNHTTIGPKPIRMRLIIPLKHKMTGPTLLQNLFPLRMYLYAFTDRTDQTWTIYDTSCVYYYRDP